MDSMDYTGYSDTLKDISDLGNLTQFEINTKNIINNKLDIKINIALSSTSSTETIVQIFKVINNEYRNITEKKALNQPGQFAANETVTIKNNDREGRTTAVDDLQSVPLLKTTYGVLREACDVLDRGEKNSDQTKEECSVVDFQSGLGVRSSTGESLKAVLPQTPDWIMDAVSIHLHNIFNTSYILLRGMPEFFDTSSALP